MALIYVIKIIACCRGSPFCILFKTRVSSVFKEGGSSDFRQEICSLFSRGIYFKFQTGNFLVPLKSHLRIGAEWLFG